VAVPTSCFAETPYFVDRVVPVDTVRETFAPGAIDPAPAGAAPPPAAAPATP
jgi:hypothetical protein